MKKFFIAFIINLFFSVSNLELVDGFPIWLKDGEKFTDQTSGITFIGTKDGKKHFLVCDDIGRIHRITFNGSNIKITTILFNNLVEEFLKKFEKRDFEEIVYDKKSNQVYLSIEGNGSDYMKEVGIYKLSFKNNNVFSDEIIGISKVDFSDWNEISKYTSINIGFEGVGVSDTKIFLGLEGFPFGDFFLDSTMIYVIDKETKKLVRTISTKDLKIHSICGLYAVNDYTIYGIDRNQQNFFEIKFDKNYNVERCITINLTLPIPGKKDLRYVAAIESIALDDENFIYVIDDPWKKYFIPSAKILKQLSEADQENFKNFIPILFKYKLN